MMNSAFPNLAVIVQLLIGTSLSVLVSVLFFNMKKAYELDKEKRKTEIDNIEKNFNKLNDHLDKTSAEVIAVNNSIQILRQELIEKVSENKLDNEKLNTEVEKLKTRMDNVEKIVDRRLRED